MTTETNNATNYLDITAHRYNENIDIDIYRKPTVTGTVIHFTSNHPHEQKIAAFNFYINRMLTLPISEKSKQKEWKTTLTIAKDNGYPSHITHNLKTKRRGKKQKHKQQQNTQILHKQWVRFTYYSPVIRRVTNLFKQTDLKIAFRAASTIQQQLTQKQACKNPSGIYKLKCNTCNAVYVGQTGRAINVRHKEHIQYIRTNNPMSA
jgi:hypothetical protein